MRSTCSCRRNRGANSCRTLIAGETWERRSAGRTWRSGRVLRTSRRMGSWTSSTTRGTWSSSRRVTRERTSTAMPSSTSLIISGWWKRLRRGAEGCGLGCWRGGLGVARSSFDDHGYAASLCSRSYNNSYVNQTYLGSLCKGSRGRLARAGGRTLGGLSALRRSRTLWGVRAWNGGWSGPADGVCRPSLGSGRDWVRSAACGWSDDAGGGELDRRALPGAQGNSATSVAARRKGRVSYLRFKTKGGQPPAALRRTLRVSSWAAASIVSEGPAR